MQIALAVKLISDVRPTGEWEGQVAAGQTGQGVPSQAGQVRKVTVESIARLSIHCTALH